jgi:hypothetical protein
MGRAQKHRAGPALYTRSRMHMRSVGGRNKIRDDVVAEYLGVGVGVGLHVQHAPRLQGPQFRPGTKGRVGAIMVRRVAVHFAQHRTYPRRLHRPPRNGKGDGAQPVPPQQRRGHRPRAGPRVIETQHHRAVARIHPPRAPSAPRLPRSRCDSHSPPDTAGTAPGSPPSLRENETPAVAAPPRRQKQKPDRPRAAVRRPPRSGLLRSVHGRRRLIPQPITRPPHRAKRKPDAKPGARPAAAFAG